VLETVASLLKLDMDIGKNLFTLSYVKQKQFDFSLLVYGNLYKEKHFLQYYHKRIISESFVSILNQK